MQKRFIQSVYDAALIENNNNICYSLSTELHLYKWSSTLNTFLFGVNSSLSPIWTDDGSVTYNASKIAEVFSTVFQNKPSVQVLNLPPTYFPNLKFTHFLLSHLTCEIKYYLNISIFMVA